MSDARIDPNVSFAKDTSLVKVEKFQMSFQSGMVLVGSREALENNAHFETMTRSSSPGAGSVPIYATPARGEMNTPRAACIGHDQVVPNHLDFLEALDTHIRNSGTDQVSHGYDMTLIARDAGLLDHAGGSAAAWTGQLVAMKLVAHGPHPPGRPDPTPGVTWSDLELQAFTAYRLTAEGLATADRERQRRRELSTDVALGAVFPTLARAAVAGVDTTGASRILRSLQSALDDELPIAAIGAAKELVEASCRCVLGEQTDRREKLPRRYKLALKEARAPETDLGVRLTSVVDQLNAMRNETGAGHGGHSDVTVADARLAAASAVAVMEYLLEACVARSARRFETAPS